MSIEANHANQSIDIENRKGITLFIDITTIARTYYVKGLIDFLLVQKSNDDYGDNDISFLYQHIEKTSRNYI